MFDLTDNYNSIESLPSIYVYYYVFFGRYLRNKMKKKTRALTAVFLIEIVENIKLFFLKLKDA